MEPLRAHRRLAVSIAGAIIFIVGLGGLPADLSWWKDALSEVGDVIGEAPIAAVAVVLGLGLIVWVNWAWIVMQLRGGAITWGSHDQAIEVIRGWLVKQKYQVTENAVPDYSHALSAAWGGTISTVALLPDDPLRLVILSSRALSTEQQGEIAGWTYSERAALLHDLRIELARFGVLFDGADEPFREVRVYDLVPLDPDFNEQALADFHMRVRRADLVMNAVVSKAFDVRDTQSAPAFALPPAPDSPADLPSEEL
ncbi:MAG: hypothetical protein DK306_002293 [Chloroflexi bacterium]|nr:MAG: hypothetical protein DK306_002293 [Chloroflexota bacterium]